MGLARIPQRSWGTKAGHCSTAWGLLECQRERERIIHLWFSLHGWARPQRELVLSGCCTKEHSDCHLLALGVHEQQAGLEVEWLSCKLYRWA